MSEIKLKPCPFCGGTNSVFVTHKEYWGYDCLYEGFVSCEACNVVLRTDDVCDDWAEAENAAIEAWNRRAD